MDPILRDLPMPLLTERLLIRGPQAGDGALINPAVHETQEALQVWMPWAQKLPSLEESEINTRRSMARWILREDLFLLVFERASQELVACSGLHRLDWAAGRFEIGYWVRAAHQGRGIIRESTTAITQYAFGALGARRVEIRCDALNQRSRKIPESLGFSLEGLLLQESVDARGQNLRDTAIYARLSPSGLPDVKASWNPSERT